MTNEEKQLLLKDLCARLPYGVICRTTSVYYDNDDNELGQVQGTLVSIDKRRASFVDYRDNTAFGAYFEYNGQIGFKPYLRPMSSMTKEEEKEYSETCFFSHEIGEIPTLETFDWLNAHQFDYRINPSTGETLIESNLAIEAPKDMYKTE